jgi:hypothetical protein
LQEGKEMAGKRISLRYWLTFSPEVGKKPLIYLMIRKYDVEFNVRSATADRDVVVLALEFTSTHDKIVDVVNRKAIVNLNKK